MKRIYTSQNHVLVVLLREALTANGVRCLIKNELLASAAGELPPIECWPELWITDDDQDEWAKAIVKTTLDSANRQWPGWQCVHCGEPLEGQFAQCWRCGHVRESGA
jgi:hypothetical protein